MSEFINLLTSDKIIRWGLLASMTFLTAAFVFLLVFFTNLPPFIPLYNQMPWGEERLGTRLELFIPLIIAVSIFFTNTILAYGFYAKMPLISRILCVATLLTSLLTLYFIFRTTILML